MTTSRITSVAAALAAFVLALSSSPGTAGTAWSAASTKNVHAEPSAYGWPVKPFFQQHPIRGFFGDPRIANHGESRQFHFGIDISAPNGSLVYATISGRIWIHPLHATTVVITGREGVEFSYWHVVPTVRTGDHATAYKTVIGRVEEPYGHVHFSEARGGRYVNPLRPGALGPYADSTRPLARSVSVVDGELVAEAYDETPIAVPRPWQDLPVMPALIRWQLFDSTGSVVLVWRTAADFRLTIPPASEFDDRWASGTTQNHAHAAGRYRVVLATSLQSLPAGSYVVEVAASDTRGNATRSRFPLSLSGS